MEQDCKRNLRGAYGIIFDRLYALTNMPISRLNNGELNPRSDGLPLSALLEENMADSPMLTTGRCCGCTSGQGSSCGGALA